KVYRVGFLANDPTIPTTAAGQAFRDGLHENGFTEGQNVSIEWRFMQGSIERAAEFAAELIRLNVDVIVSSGTQSHPAVKRATAKIPIVMANSQDPVGQGLVASLAHPGGNITGLVQIESAQFGGKRLQLFKDAVPQISRVGVIINPELKTDAAQWDVSERAANSLGITLQAVRARQGSELIGALTDASRSECIVRPGQWHESHLSQSHCRFRLRAPIAVYALVHGGRNGRRSHGLRPQPTRSVPPCGHLCGEDF